MIKRIDELLKKDRAENISYLTEVITFYELLAYEVKNRNRNRDDVIMYFLCRIIILSHGVFKPINEYSYEETDCHINKQPLDIYVDYLLESIASYYTDRYTCLSFIYDDANIIAITLGYDLEKSIIAVYYEEEPVKAVEEESLTFAEALDKLQKEGGYMRIEKWSPDVKIRIKSFETDKSEAPYLFVESRHGLVPWNPTQIEILTEKWRHIND